MPPASPRRPVLRGLRGPGTALALLLALAAMLAGCQSPPLPDAPLPASSSVLGVDVRFPVSLGRDPTLARVWFVRGPIHDQQEKLPELVPATVIKGSRAYLLDPAPGTWSLAAVLSDYAPPRSHVPIAGVTGAVLPTADAGDLIVFPSEMIHRTRTTIAPGAVKYMGTLEVRAGDRVTADTLFMDLVPERLAEAIRPGVTAETGFAGRFSTTFTLDTELSSWRDGPAERAAFVRNAVDDFGTSPWSDVMRGPDPVTRDTARRAPPPPLPPPPAPEATDAVPAPPEPAETPVPAPSSPGGEPESPAGAPDPIATPAPGPPAEAPDPIATPAPEPPAEAPDPIATPAPEPPAPATASLPPGDARAVQDPARAPLPRLRFPNVPTDSSLSVVEFGMSHDEVHALLGEPDEKHRRLIARGWLPFYTGADALRIDWVYEGEGRVVFAVHEGVVTVVEVHAGEP